MSKNARIGDRIKVLEEKLKKSGITLGKDAGLGNKTVDGWLQKGLDFSTNTLEVFLKHYNINPEWWKTGNGEIFLAKIDGLKEKKLPNNTDHVVLFIETINRLIEKREGEISHLRGNEHWYQNLIDELRAESGLPKGPKQ